MTVSVLSPRKSIFSRPTRSISFIAHCVVISSVLALVERHELGERPRRDHDAGGVHRGVPRQPSRRRPTSSSSLTFGSFCCAAPCSAGFSLERLVERHVERRRDQLGDPVDLGERHVQARGRRPGPPPCAFIVPKVMIWATFSRPYLRVTYSMTSPRRSSQKSMSISGSDTRSGFRKRSKSRSNCERVDVGDAQAVGDDAAGRRAAARADRDAAARARSG